MDTIQEANTDLVTCYFNTMVTFYFKRSMQQWVVFSEAACHQQAHKRTGPTPMQQMVQNTLLM